MVSRVQGRWLVSGVDEKYVKWVEKRDCTFKDRYQH
jgi:hypothetical protein